MKRIIIILPIIGFVVGCTNVRYSAIPKVSDIGTHVVTRDKYRLSGYMVGQRSVQFGDIKDSLERNYPNVFADNGIPFSIQETANRNFKSEYGWTFLFPYLLSIGTLPMVTHVEHDTLFTVNVGGVNVEYEINIAMDQALTCYTPFALMCYNAPPDTYGYRGFYRVKAYGGDNDRVIANRLAIGYATAVKLKELEQNGRMTTVLEPKQVPAVTSPASETPPNASAPSGSRPAQVYEVKDITL